MAMVADHRKPLDGTLFLASEITLVLVSIPAFIPKPAQIITLIIVGWYFSQIIFTQTTGNFHNDSGLASILAFQYLIVLDYALLTPLEDLKDLDDHNPTRVSQRTLKERVRWTLKLLSNPRGIGWAHEPSDLPPRPSPSTSRSRFVISRILFATCCFWISTKTQLFDTTYTAGSMSDKLLTDTDGATFRWRVVEVLRYGLGVSSTMSTLNSALAIGIVGCGFSSPDRWPLLFGSPLRVWSIRTFWRTCWHQLFRRCVVTFTSSTLRCILPEKFAGTTGHKLAQLYVAFGISALAHAGGDVMATGKLGFKSFTFFMLQPFGITIELGVSYLWHRLQGNVQLDPKNSTTNESAHNLVRSPSKNRNGKSLENSVPPLWVRCVGFVWVVFWLLWTAAYVADALILARLSANQIRPKLD